jgi:hypothetical protein
MRGGGEGKNESQSEIQCGSYGEKKRREGGVILEK